MSPEGGTDATRAVEPARERGGGDEQQEGVSLLVHEKKRRGTTEDPINL